MFATSQKGGFFQRLSNFFPARKLKKEQLDQLRYMLQKAVSDGVITDEEIAEIDSFFNSTDLSVEEFTAIKNAVFNDVLESYCSDRRVTPKEEMSLKQMAFQLGFNAAALDAIDQHINYFSLLHIVETCPFDLLPANGANGVVLQTGEIAYVSFAVALLEERVVRREWVGRSSGISVPIVKGVRYRVGQSRGHLVSETGIVPVANGNFTITNKRLIFSGDRKSFNAPLNKILDIDMYSDGLRLAVTSRQKPVYIQFFTTQSAELTAMYISRVLNG